MTVVNAGTTMWCEYCKVFQLALFVYTLEMYVFDHIFDLLKLLWKAILICIGCAAPLETQTAGSTSTCPYQPWCMGTSMWVQSSNGVQADCVCNCGATWTEYNPL
jgi:hypothetical protein